MFNFHHFSYFKTYQFDYELIIEYEQYLKKCLIRLISIGHIFSNFSFSPKIIGDHWWKNKIFTEHRSIFRH